MRMSEDQFAELTKNNPTLKYRDICAPASQASPTKRQRQNKTKAQKQIEALTPTISPHAKAMAELARDPSLSSGDGEHWLQVSVMDALERKHPDIYDLTAAVPNGGKRYKKTAWRMKAEGQKPGYMDLLLDAARGVYHGFRCEVKTDEGKPSDSQLEYAAKLRKQGYCVVFAYGYDAVMRSILEYWLLPSGAKMVGEVYR